MNKIIFPLKFKMSRREIGDLHKALAVLGYAIAENEIDKHRFGTTTRKAVLAFQKQFDLEPTGEVDEKTAAALTSEWAAQARTPPVDERNDDGAGGGGEEKTLHITGMVIDRNTKKGFAGLRIEPWHDGHRIDKVTGKAVTDKDGKFQINVKDPDIDEWFKDDKPVIDFKIFRGTEAITVEEDAVSWKLKKNKAEVMIEVELDAAEAEFMVQGKIRDIDGNPLVGVNVRASDKDLRSEELLGETNTDEEGHYEIAYTAEQFSRAEKDSADLIVRVFGSTSNTELVASEIIFNAQPVETVDLLVGGGQYQGLSDFEVLTDTLMPLLENVSPLDLREDPQFQDISFLAGESGRSELVIGTWVFCHRLADKTQQEELPLEAAVFFGFMRQGQPALLYDTLLEDMKYPERIALLEDKLLRELANIGAELHRSLLEQAIADNLIPLRITSQLDDILETLRQIRLRYSADTTHGGGKGTIGQLLELNPLAKQQQTAFMAVYTEHNGPLSEFWEKIESDQVLDPETVRDVRLTFELGALTRNHIPLVGELRKLFQQGEVQTKRELAKYSREDWKQVFTRPGPDGSPIGVPPDTDGENDEEKREQFAAIIEQRFERAYPTMSFAAKLARSEQSPVGAKEDVVRFIENNPAFHIDRYRLDQYIAENEDALAGITDTAALIANLKSVQRIFKLNSTYKAVDALLSRNIDSAQKIYFMGKGQFITAVTDAVETGAGVTPTQALNKIEAKRIYHKAENAYALALTLYGNYNNAVNGVVPFGVPTPNSEVETQGNIPTPAPDTETPGSILTPMSDSESLEHLLDVPDLQALFGSLDYCECSHCRSVYSPAAYFVDVMHFLGERETQGTEIHMGKYVNQVLLERRPDLGEIELSCENTNTPLPYIDLVNEILEDVVAPPNPVTLNSAIEVDLTPGEIKQSVFDELTDNEVVISADAQVYDQDSRDQWVIRDQGHAYKLFKSEANLQLLPTKQTFLSAAELRANPEYTNPLSYDKLALEIFPFDLPFDLWQLQTRSYLNHLGVPQPKLFELFQQKLVDDVTLSPGDLQVDCAWLGISETERKIITNTLVDTQPWEFWGLPENVVDPGDNISKSWIEWLGKVDVMLHRSGRTYKELLQLLDMNYINPDGALVIFDNTDSNTANCDTSTFTILGLTEDVLNRIHRFIRLWRKLGCEMWELDILLPRADSELEIEAEIADTILQDISGMDRLRQRFDLDWRIVYSLYNDIDHHLYVNRNKDGAPALQTLYQRLFRNKLVDAVASFPEHPEQIDSTIAESVPGILAAFRIKEADLDLILTDLELSATDSLVWLDLSRIYRITILAKALSLNIDNFLRLKRLWSQDPFVNPVATLSYIKLANKIADSGFSIQELDYLLAHRYTANSSVALKDRRITAALKDIREGLQIISDDIRLKTEESLQDYIKSHLGFLPTLTKDADQVQALSLIDGSWEGTIADRESLIERYFVNLLDLTEAQAKLAAIPAGLSAADYQAEVDKHFEYVQPALEALLLQNQKEAFIRQKIAEIFQLQAPVSEELLTGLRLPGATETLLQTINAQALLSQLTDGSYEFSINETNFPDIYKALRLLHKNALLIAKLRIKADEVAWWLEGSHASDLGWLHPNDLPIDTTIPVAVVQWERLYDFFSWKNNLPNSDLTAFELMDEVLDVGATPLDNIARLAQLTAWEAEDISELVAGFRWDVKQEFSNSASLQRLADCMQAIHRLGVNATRAIQWANAEPSMLEAESLKQTVKAKYDLLQWQEVIQPIQDMFREQKRTALVSWLVTHPNQDQNQGQNWSDADGLYNYFLIDVEMSACMLTSRIKQASASAQLFVQRCLMNLEVDIRTIIELDSRWKQWKWMKYYRVWEANRKVFLYPENWLEPELRDEKSPFFKDLEDELMQNDINHDTAEQAYLNYLEKLDKVANLEIRSMYKEIINSDDSNKSLLHVFGRSRSSLAPEYYYRKQINAARWTAWEKVDLEINTNHLVAGVHNRRLYLLWPQFVEKADQEESMNIPSQGDLSYKIPEPKRYWEMRLFWSELKSTKWTSKVLSDSFSHIEQSSTGNTPQNIGLRIRHKPHIGVRVFTSRNPVHWAPRSNNYFDKIGRQINYLPHSSLREHIIAPPQSQYFNNLVQHTSASNFFYYSVLEERSKFHSTSPHQNAESIQLLKKIRPTFTYSVLDSQAKGFLDVGSYFMWDSRRTYFVDYNSYSKVHYVSGASRTKLINSFRFFVHYHPFVELFIKELNSWGIKGLLNRQIQIDPAGILNSPAIFDFSDYQPTNNVTKNYQLADSSLSYPVEDVDFSYMGAYAPYNWELFFHVPFFIANKLSTNQRFEEALQWFHYIFDPTNTDMTTIETETPQQKYWITKPFYETTKADYYRQKIENIMLAIAKGDAELLEQVKEWRANPFNPHLIARMRTVAYQKNVLIKYIQTLIAWGDQLFRRDSIETVNEATQLYILAASILGPRPKSIPKNVANPIKTFYQLEQEGIGDFGNVLTQIENLLPSVSSDSTMSEDGPELPRLEVLYFCVPNNEKLSKLWDTVADRLFKIRHCMNIQGVVRQLPLFEPPIDPSMLIKATAAGLDIGVVLNDMNAPMPLYRFSFMIQRALELCNEVKSLGNALLSALEKKDAEGLALLRSSNELIMLDAIRLIKEKQIDEALRSKESLDESKKVIEERKNHYDQLIKDGWNTWEELSFGMSSRALAYQGTATTLDALKAQLSLMPEFTSGGSGLGSPHIVFSIGGREYSFNISGASDVAKGIANILQLGASMTSTIAGYERRQQDWELQKRLAEKELPQMDKQIAAADIRHQIAKQDLTNHERQTENSQKEDEYMRDKFTNQELYDWMINQLSTVYFQSYQLAYDMAKRAERCYRYELGLSDSNYIQFGYWDSLKKGLLSGEQLHYDIKRLETAFYEQNRREYELTKHISLAQLDAVALLKLRQNGECFVDIPETVFDMDYPGHYFRRIKTVGLSIPCVVGPYTTIACTLTLTSNHLRKDARVINGKYERDTENDDPRFRDEIAAIQSIATSSARNDAGLFELNFRDERYLPFEGAGAVSSWHIKLNKDFPQFDFSTITDVIIHMNFMAREGGELLKSKVVTEFNKKMNDLALAENKRGLYRVFDLKREYSDEWHKFLHPANTADDQEMVLEDLPDRLPYFTQKFATKKVKQIEVVALMANEDTYNEDTYKVMLSPLGDTDLLSLVDTDATYQGLHRALKDLEGAEVDLNTWTLKIKLDGATDFKSLPADAIEELFLIINYTIA